MQLSSVITKNILSTLLITNLILAQENQGPSCTVPGLIGEQPQKVCSIIETLKEFQAKHKNDSPEEQKTSEQKIRFKNRMLLYGPPGTGKSTIAVKIAEQTGRKLIHQPGANIVGRYAGQGAETISLLFDEAIKHIQSTAQGVVIVIDEINNIGTENSTENLKEHAAARDMLWILLDQHKDNANLLVIVTTNHYDELSRPFKERFGYNVTEVGMPNTATRKLLIEHYFNQEQIKLHDNEIDELVKSTENSSPRIIEDAAMGAATILKDRRRTNSNSSISIEDIKKVLIDVKKNQKDADRSSEARQKEEYEYRKSRRPIDESNARWTFYGALSAVVGATVYVTVTVVSAALAITEKAAKVADKTSKNT